MYWPPTSPLLAGSLYRSSLERAYTVDVGGTADTVTDCVCVVVVTVSVEERAVSVMVIVGVEIIVVTLCGGKRVKLLDAYGK